MACPVPYRKPSPAVARCIDARAPQATAAIDLRPKAQKRPILSRARVHHCGTPPARHGRRRAEASAGGGDPARDARKALDLAPYGCAQAHRIGSVAGEPLPAVREGTRLEALAALFGRLSARGWRVSGRTAPQAPERSRVLTCGRRGLEQSSTSAPGLRSRRHICTGTACAAGPTRTQ